MFEVIPKGSFHDTLSGIFIDSDSLSAIGWGEALRGEENTIAGKAQPPDSGRPSAPSISLPKGGGAVRGIGEKFAANPVTGTGSVSVPIATSPGRSGFGPQLSLAYDSGAGNGPFGLGWSLSLPAITRKTEKGLPRYLDVLDSDTFVLSDAEDLVPAYRRDRGGDWVRNVTGRLVVHEDDRDGYRIRRYLPRVEGLFARIERWTEADGDDVHWRSISRDNVLTIYGRDESSRITDPTDPTRIFSWLICETRDDKGNAIVYEYKRDDGAGVDLSRSHERNRGGRRDPRRCVNRYPKRIRYGNTTPLLDRSVSAGDVPDLKWLFEVVFDYGEHAPRDPTPSAAGGEWGFRADPFSSYRSGFEVRTTRLCQRVLMFHHVPGREGYDGLVRSTDLTFAHEADGSDPRPNYTVLRAVSHVAYRRRGGGYLKREMPPVEFTYSPVVPGDEVHDVDVASLENLPVGLDGSAYRWTDLHGEGIPGILTEQAGAWYYKANLTPVSDASSGAPSVRLAATERVSLKPSFVLADGQAEFMDLAGNGQPDFVAFGDPLPGSFEHDGDFGWQPFRPFTARLNRDFRDPNLRLIDLDGDGRADVMVTEDDAFVWHSSQAEEGFGPARRAPWAQDEEDGPRLVFADGTQSIYLGDFSGDGLTDLARIRNGEVCYWPNLGHGRFGAKVTMDNAPVFDRPDLFDHGRLRLADIDGTGTVDIIYLHADGVRLYFNEAGNGWSAPRILNVFPRVDDLVSIVPVDLFGNGTACLVWSSPLPCDERRQIRYVDLMGGRKPHLLVGTKNNLGAETSITYAASTRFYLADKLAGRPWITRLPFPVHVVERVTVTDRWRQTRFSSSYSYHHGRFDGIEREFCGFGRVEQVDTEAYGDFDATGSHVTDDRTLYQAPVKTVTWYHTGALLDRERVLSQYEREYFPNGVGQAIPGTFRENALPEPDIAQEGLTFEERRQAMRACKGMKLRQEIYELDAGALENGVHRPVRLFSTAYHNCHIRRLQPQAGNRHGVFLATESEAITYHYELDLTPGTLTPDPRIAHTLNLRVDELGNVLQSVAVVYPRLGEHVGADLPPGTPELIREVQREMHLAYTETRYTSDIDEEGSRRLRVPCEVLTYELTGITPQGASLPGVSYLSLDELRRLHLSPVHQTGGEPVTEIGYHVLPHRADPQKRLVEHVRMFHFADNLRSALPLDRHGRLGLPHETRTLALTDDLLAAVLGDDKLDDEVRRGLDDTTVSGYLRDGDQYWIGSGVVGYHRDDIPGYRPADHFFVPVTHTDPFGAQTIVDYDDFALAVLSTTDPIGSTQRIRRFDYRVLAPQAVEDLNGNLTTVAFDVLGLPCAVAAEGKGESGDSLSRIEGSLDPDPRTLAAFFTAAAYDDELARVWLGDATGRHVYYLGETVGDDGVVTWGTHPPCACGIVRERHVGHLGEASPLQVAFEYSDASGNILVTKIQAEPEDGGTERRWIASGKTILNNKGKPVKQYKPYFTARHTFEDPVEAGVTPIFYYDAVGRTVRTELPDGSFSWVEVSPWHVRTFDPNDTVREPGNRWYAERTSSPQAGEADRRAAALALLHADTPAQVFLDSLGREVVSVAHNRVPDTDPIYRNTALPERPWTDEKYVTFTKLDAEGKPLWIRDARGNRVMQYIHPPLPNGVVEEPERRFVPCYDIAGNLLYQSSMDAGARWMLCDAAGQPLFAWDAYERRRGEAVEHRRYRTAYDALRRPLEQRLRLDDDPDEIVIERFVYGENQQEDRDRNLRGQIHAYFDASGLVRNDSFDFKGNLLQVSRTLVREHGVAYVDWSREPPESALGDEEFVKVTEYDALNRMTRLYNWHRGEGARVAVYEPRYNARGLIEAEDLVVGATRWDGSYQEPSHSRRIAAISDIAYDAKGQRTRLRLGNGTETLYDYDPETFRLRQIFTTRSLNGEVLQQLLYTYDAAGNITEVEDRAYMPVFFQNQIVAPRSLCTYDALYRLIEATGRENAANVGPPPQRPGEDPGVTFPITDLALRTYRQRYHYDAVGNFVTMRHIAEGGRWTRRYATAPDSNRLERTWIGSDEAAAVTYAYDSHGSMLSLNAAPEDAFPLFWDHRDMIHRADLGNGEALYQYDAGKQRTRKLVSYDRGPVRERIYLGGFELFREYNGDGNVTEQIESHHLFLDDQRVLLVDDVIATGNHTLGTGILFRYQYGNNLGSVALELDEGGGIVSCEEYHPYGTSAYRARGTGVRATAKRYRYTGMERDEETGLGYHTARHCASWLGRWVSADPINLTGGINLYVFVACRPACLIDSSGTQSEALLHDPDDLDYLSQDLERIEDPELVVLGALEQEDPFAWTDLAESIDPLLLLRTGPPIWSEIPERRARKVVDHTSVLSIMGPLRTRETLVESLTLVMGDADAALVDQIANDAWNIITNNSLNILIGLSETARVSQINIPTIQRILWLALERAGAPRPFHLATQMTGIVEDAIGAPANAMPGLFAPSRSIAGSRLPPGMSRVGAFLAPLGVVSNALSLEEAITRDPSAENGSLIERSFDVAASGAGLFSSGVGTTALAGAGLEAAGASGAGSTLVAGATGPVVGGAAAVAGAGAGGAAVGTLLDYAPTLWGGRRVSTWIADSLWELTRPYQVQARRGMMR